VLTAALVLSGCASGAESQPHANGLHGTEIENPFEAPATPLTDTDGAAYSLAGDTTKPLTLLFFGYTHCPDICQMVLANIASGVARLDPADQEKVEVVFVTTDPARDDEKTLRSYLDRFGGDMVGLTGELDDIVGVAKSFGVFMEKEKELPTGGYDVSHTTNVFAIDADDQAPVTWHAGTTAADLAADLTTLLDEKGDS
jgi:protein SCO1/2